MSTDAQPARSTSSVPVPNNPPRGRVGLWALAAVLALGAFIGAGLFVVDHSEATSYISYDPRACANCHVMRDEYNGWARSSHHAAATCNDCHTPHNGLAKWQMKAVHGVRHSYGFTFDNFHEPIQIKSDSLAVVEQNCLRCHAEIAGDIGPQGLQAHARHETAGTDFTASITEISSSCIHCHANVGHGPAK